MTYGLLFDRVLSRMDPEDAHHRAVAAIRTAGSTTVLRAAVRAATAAPSSPCAVMGLTFPHPFGLAAGFDKDARMVPGLLALGFGHVEVGTVTGRPQPGNPRPRLFRLVDDRAVVNRMGFNNDGAEVVARRLAALRDHGPARDAVVGVNIGKTKVVPADEAVADYVRSTRLLAPHASYLVVNVSSPNTPGLRDLQATEALRPLLGAVRDATGDVRDRHLPLLVKVAPDLADDDLDAVADLAVELGLDGLVAANTTIARPASLRTPRATVDAAGAGGLSGPVLAARATEVLRRLRARVGGRLALVSVGGVVTADDARSRLEAGADLVQGYTAFVYEGPLWAARIARGLAGR